MVKRGAGLQDWCGLNILPVNETPCLLYTTCANKYRPTKNILFVDGNDGIILSQKAGDRSRRNVSAHTHT